MWTALKMEQHDLHRDMDITSDEFLDMVGERFNDVMRKTQVYDSILVKSQLMRNQSWYAKTITAFRAEPTLSLNLFIDAIKNVKEKGGKKNLAAVISTFLISAIAQAAVKGIMSAGRSPDEKKTLAENFAYRFGYSFIGEANPLSLIPGYDNLIDALSGNDINDNAWGMINTFADSLAKIWNPPTGEDATIQDGYRYIEDTVGQITQMFSGIPAKNLMRDTRAIYNWFLAPYADREHQEKDKKTGEIKTVEGRASSGAVMRMQLNDLISSEDLIGLINGRLDNAIWDKSANAYYDRIYEAEKAEDEARAGELREYMQLGKGTAEKSIDSAIVTRAKNDESMTAAERAEWLLDKEYMDKTSWITTEFKEGEITEAEMRKLYAKYHDA